MTTISLLNNQDNWLTNEMDVVQDLIDENIQATGSDLRYFPKEQLNLNEMFGESTVSKFKSGFDIEMYLARVTHHNGEDDIFSKFGMVRNDEATLLVSVRRFSIVGQDHGLKQPLEDDVIYMPFSNTLWKIRKVKHDEEYFQFGQNRVWRLEVGLFDPSHETFENDDITPEDLQQVARQVDDLGLTSLLGISEELKQDEGEVFKEVIEQSLPTTFDSDNPFGE